MLDTGTLSRAQVPFARDLAGYGDRPAVLTATAEISYRELAQRVDDAIAALGADRRLVLIAGANALEPLVVHLACLAAGHPVLLVPGDDPRRIAAMVEAYDPDTTCTPDGDRWRLDHRHEAPVHELHPDLALLLSTSGSTGSPKLVRLSHENLQANAEAIVAALGIRDTDRAATTLPLHYSYGLSVVHSHLQRGAAIVLTDLSVVDACFWDLFRRHRATTLAGVPYTFDLLDRIGFADLQLPSLRYVTQAGGRLDPDRVRGYAELGRRRGWDLFVMYGQTEATARMACLPPDLALSNPEAIGVPIPGGAFDLDGDELVYRGPNVMLGYAESPADLRLGREIDHLRTGDLARRTADGLYEIVGRRSRFAKVLGLRVDLQRVEELLAADGVRACCAERDGRLVAAVEPPYDDAQLRRRIARDCGLPPRAVQVVGVDALPRLPSGKPDVAAVAALGTASGDRPVEDLRDLYAQVLERDDVTDDSSFVSLGGDSLSYVEMSVRLEAALGHLPPGWHTTRIRDLDAAARPRTRRVLETSIALRAVAILLIVGTHANVFDLSGGAHVLLAVAGYNFARFHLGRRPRAERTRRLVTSAARIAVPSMLWIAGAAAVLERYDVANVLLLGTVVGPGTWTQAWHFWFVEVLVHLLVLLTALLAIPAVHRLERRHAFGFAVGLLAVGLALRFTLGTAPNAIHTAAGVLWLFALGWAAARATSRVQLAALTAVLVAAVPGFFTDTRRGVFVVVGIALLLWVRSVPSTRLVSRVAGVLAASSLYVYVTHFVVYPHLENDVPLLAAAASFAVGIAYWQVVVRAPRLLMTGITRAIAGIRPPTLVRVP